MAPRAKAAKSEEARAQEARLIAIQLQDLGVPEEDLAAMKAALRVFADEGVGHTQAYKLRHLGVEVLLQLSTQSHVVSFARVRRL